MPHRVLGNRVRNQELLQVIRTTCLGANTTHLVTSKRLSPDYGSGNWSVYVEVPALNFAAGFLNVLRGA